jgi:transposase-like protein
MRCSHCNSLEVVKNGSTSTGKQKYKCKSCNRQFVLNPKSNKIGEETKQLIDKLLLEKISLGVLYEAPKFLKDGYNIM